jgi:hypothetical protein
MGSFKYDRGFQGPLKCNQGWRAWLEVSPDESVTEYGTSSRSRLADVDSSSTWAQQEAPNSEHFHCENQWSCPLFNFRNSAPSICN